jgi:hypothetical protein
MAVQYARLSDSWKAGGKFKTDQRLHKRIDLLRILPPILSVAGAHRSNDSHLETVIEGDENSLSIFFGKLRVILHRVPVVNLKHKAGTVIPIASF